MVTHHSTKSHSSLRRSKMLYVVILILFVICINQGDKIRRLKRELDEVYKSKESLRTGLENNIEMLREQLSHYRQ